MTPVAAGTAIGAAAVTVGRGALGAVGNTLSFAAELVRSATRAAPAPQNSVDPAPAVRAAVKARTDEMQQRIQQQLATAGLQLFHPRQFDMHGPARVVDLDPQPPQVAIDEAVRSH